MLPSKYLHYFFRLCLAGWAIVTSHIAYQYITATADTLPGKWGTVVEGTIESTSYLPYTSISKSDKFYQSLLYRGCGSIATTTGESTDSVVDDEICRIKTQDYQTYYITMITGQYWSDTRPITIADVYFTYHHIVQLNQRQLTDLANLSKIDVQMIGDYKLQVNFPSSSIDNNLFFTNPILPATLSGQTLDHYTTLFASAPITNGCATFDRLKSDRDNTLFNLSNCPNYAAKVFQIKRFPDVSWLSTYVTTPASIVDFMYGKYALSGYRTAPVSDTKLLVTYFNVNTLAPELRKALAGLTKWLGEKMPTIQQYQSVFRYNSRYTKATLQQLLTQHRHTTGDSENLSDSDSFSWASAMSISGSNISGYTNSLVDTWLIVSWSIVSWEIGNLTGAVISGSIASSWLVDASWDLIIWSWTSLLPSWSSLVTTSSPAVPLVPTATVPYLTKSLYVYGTNKYKTYYLPAMKDKFTTTFKLDVVYDRVAIAANGWGQYFPTSYSSGTKSTDYNFSLSYNNIKEGINYYTLWWYQWEKSIKLLTIKLRYAQKPPVDVSLTTKSKAISPVRVLYVRDPLATGLIDLRTQKLTKDELLSWFQFIGFDTLSELEWSITTKQYDVVLSVLDIWNKSDLSVLFRNDPIINPSLYKNAEVANFVNQYYVVGTKLQPNILKAISEKYYRDIPFVIVGQLIDYLTLRDHLDVNLSGYSNLNYRDVLLRQSKVSPQVILDRSKILNISNIIKFLLTELLK